MPDRGSVGRWFSEHGHRHGDDTTNSHDEKSTTDQVSGLHSQNNDGITGSLGSSIPLEKPKHINPFSVLKESRNHSTSHSARMERLKEFHMVFLIDDSPGMQRDWAEALSFLGEVIPECLRHTESGVSIFFTHQWTAEPSRYEEQWKPEWPVPSGHLDIKYVTMEAAVANGFPPEASAEFVLDNVAPVDDGHDDGEKGPTTRTPSKPPHTMASRLAHILRPYVQAYQAGTSGDERFKHIANVDVIVVTNGADGDDVQTETLAIAQDLNECGAPTSQVGIQFVQIGGDAACAAMLRDLDSDIVLSDRDIVDTVSYGQTRDPRTGRMTDDGLYKVLLGGVSRKVDMRRLENGHFLGKQ